MVVSPLQVLTKNKISLHLSQESIHRQQITQNTLQLAQDKATEIQKSPLQREVTVTRRPITVSSSNTAPAPSSDPAKRSQSCSPPLSRQPCSCPPIPRLSPGPSLTTAAGLTHDRLEETLSSSHPHESPGRRQASLISL